MFNEGTFKRITRSIIAIGLVFTMSTAFANGGNSNDGNNDGPGTYAVGAQQIIAMITNAPSEDFETARKSIDTALDFVDRKPYQQVIDALIRRLDTEIGRGNFLADIKPGEKHDGMNIVLVEYLIDVVGSMAPAEYAPQLEALVKKVTDIANSNEVTKMAFEHRKLGDKFEIYLKACRSNNAKLVALPGSDGAAYGDKALADELKEFRSHLENEIKGQPEVIDALVAIRQKDLVYGHRLSSPSLWLLGLPGVGKDTSARGYANAVNGGDPQAWKKNMYTISPLVGKEDLWSILGSGTGYVGSDNFPPFLDFLVEHSGGKYIKVNGEPDEKAKPKWKVVENPNYKPGDIYDNPPEKAVLYLDEFHKWSKDIKDLFVKKALETDGTFRIYNPNEGLDKISVPLTIIIGSNDGIPLLASREKNGQRFGPPLSYPEMLAKQQRVAKDKNAIANAILGGGGSVGGGEISKGTSEELLNRVKTVLVMRPLSPEQLREIADRKLRLMLETLSKSTGGYQNLKIEFAPEVVNFIQEFHYVAEDNARPIDERIESLFEEPLFTAFAEGAVKKGETATVRFNIRKESDNTYTGLIEFPGAKPSRPTHTVPIRATEIERAKKPISDEELMVLDLLPEQLKQDVVGQDKPMEQIARALKLTEEGRATVGTASEAKTAARTFLLLGYSSVGKTQTGKAVAKHLLKDESAVVTIGFSPDMTERDLNEMILGTKDFQGNAIPSKFMQYYDRSGGRLVVLLDEVANVRNKDILNKLYDLFREPTVTTFSDGRERVMSNVIFLVTGNAGQELHKELPSHLPEVVRREAMQEVHRRLISNPNLQREIYEQYFSAPLLARIGDDNIFNYGPLDYLAAGKLVQLKMKSALNNLKSREGRRGFNVVFKDQEAYTKIVDAIEREGFNTREQGASIDHFVQKKFEEGLREMLLSQLVPDGAQVVVDFAGIELAQVTHDDGVDAETELRNKVIVNVTANGKTTQLKMEGIQRSPDVPRMKREMILTAFHEAGHWLVRAALMGEYYKAGGIKVVPGVAHIAGKWVHYEGLATSNPILRLDTTREFLVREIAVLFGGAVAEDLIVQGGYSSHGKQNDMQRATALAQRAILELGLVPEWGFRNAKLEALSEADRNKLNELVEALLKEGRDLAVEAIRANDKVFEHAGNELTRRGELTGKELDQMAQTYGLKVETDDGYEAAAKASRLSDQVGGRRGIGYKLIDSIKFIDESEIVDMVKTLEDKRMAQINQLVMPAGTPLLSGTPAPTPSPTAPVPANDTKAPRKKRTPPTVGPIAAQTCENLLGGE